MPCNRNAKTTSPRGAKLSKNHVRGAAGHLVMRRALFRAYADVVVQAGNK